MKLKGLRVVWTVHNLESHGRVHPRLELWCQCRFIDAVDGVIHLTDTGRVLAESKYPALVLKKSAIIFHGHYRDAYPNVIGKAVARKKLGLGEDDRVVLFIGMVRPYKNVENLIRTFSAMVSTDLRLVVAGVASINSGLERNIRQLASEDSRVSLHLEHISSDDITVFLNAADLVVLPYLDILNSGSAILALSFGRPVLVPQIGAMTDLQCRFGSHRVHLYQNELSPQILATVLDAVTSPGTEAEAGRQDMPMEYEWDHIAGQTFSFYTNVLSPGKDSLKKGAVL
ncbi:MAG: glycosyltransferase [Pseudohongiellaceae bacterium]